MRIRSGIAFDNVNATSNINPSSSSETPTADIMSSSGDDTYHVPGDVVSEAPGGGTDLVISTISYSLGDNVENLTLSGSGNIDGTGNGLNNIIIGNGGANTINGGAGNDSIDSLGGTDTVNGEAGNDRLWSTVFGSHTNNGGAGNDTIGGGFYYGNTWDGGADSDTVDVTLHNFAATIDLTAGTYATGGGRLKIIDFENVNAGNQDDTIIGTTGANTLHGNDGNDTLDGGLSYDDYLDGGAGNDAVDYSWYSAGAGLHTVIDLTAGTYVDDVGSETLVSIESVLGGQNEETIKGTSGANLINGNDGNDNITGLAGNDTLTGGAGNDTINAGAISDGQDSVDGGDGDDLLTSSGWGTTLGGLGNDTVFAGIGANETLNGGAGIDTLNTSLFSGDYTVNLATGVTDYAPESFINFENIISGAGNDTITGSASANWIDGGAGADSMTGGAGNDTFIVDDAGDTATEAGNQGTDLVYTSVSFVMAASVENLIMTGIDNINATGNTSNNNITGNDGNNSIDGKVGNDSMTGGLGDDTYYVDNIGDRVYENDGEGTDLVYSTVTYSGATQAVENITLTGSADINALGNALNNIVIGNNGNNDLNGSLGADTMNGGAGNDTYAVDNVGDVVIETSTGIDVVNSKVSFDIGANLIEVVNLISGLHVNAYGGTTGRAETLNGNTGNNILDGRGGSDTMAGGLGNDTYYVERTTDLVTENVGEGTDLVYSTVTYTLTANVENLILQGAANTIGTGNVLDNRLTGNTGANKLLGLDGNDWLDGSLGNDTMTGGIGNDTYVVDSATDSVVELSGEGTDTVQASVSYTLATAADIETLTLTGVADINGRGNALVNTINGNAGNNVLDGAAGADTMVGGLGNDTFVVDDAGDVTVDVSTGGLADTVNASVTYTLGSSAYIEIFNLTGVGNINGTGNNIANTITGNSGANILNGGNGADILNGGAGNDTFIGGSGADNFVFTVGSGLDVINDFKSVQNDLINVNDYTHGVVNGGGVVIFQSGTSAIIDLGGGNTITVLNTTASDPNFLSHITW